MLCPNCNADCAVINTRQKDYGRMRRYECPNCKERFTTVEVIDMGFRWGKPSATEKKQNGRWKTYVLDGVMGDRPTVLACSNCRRVSTVKTPYCAQCGAKMEVEGDA